MYNLIYAITQGADHIKHQIPCEDAGIVYETDFCRIFAVGDGHGDSNCPRSRLGSAVACRVAGEELEEFCQNIRENAWEAKLLSDEKESRALIRQLVTSIVAKWIKIVNEDLASASLTEEERAGCSRYIEQYDRGEHLEHIYGTTLIAGLQTDSYLLLIQQGDGRCVVFDQSGAVTQPIPWDEKCFANVTTSLCDEDAIQRFRYSVIDLKTTPVIACLAGSDGVEDSFPSMDMMHVYYRDLLTYAAQNGAEALNAHLAETLPEFSRNGSGDDVTICGMINIDGIALCLPVFERDSEIVRRENLLHALEERRDSMNGMGKLDALKNRFEEASARILTAEQELQSATDLLESYTEDLQQLKEDEEAGSEKLKIWNRLIDLVLPGVRTEALEKMKEKLLNEKLQAEQELQKAQEAFLPIQNEYLMYTARRDELERNIEKSRQGLAELREADMNAP